MRPEHRLPRFLRRDELHLSREAVLVSHRYSIFILHKSYNEYLTWYFSGVSPPKNKGSEVINVILNMISAGVYLFAQSKDYFVN